MRLALVAAFCLVSLAAATGVRADGALPAQPYHYLHPPPAFANENVAPFNGKRVLPLDYERSTSWVVFTDDGQAGISSTRGGFAASAPATAVVVDIKPVEAPSGLPSQVALDGNAYSIAATTQPGKAPVQLAHAVNLTLRWPHLPLAIYEYRGGSWQQLCYSNKAVLTPSTISCPTSTLGTFAAVTSPSNTSTNTPSTPWSRLNPYLPVLSAVVLIIAAIAVGYLVTRPDKRAG